MDALKLRRGERYYMRAPWSTQTCTAELLALKDTWRGLRALVEYHVADTGYHPPKRYKRLRWVQASKLSR